MKQAVMNYFSAVYGLNLSAGNMHKNLGCLFIARAKKDEFEKKTKANYEVTCSPHTPSDMNNSFSMPKNCPSCVNYGSSFAVKKRGFSCRLPSSDHALLMKAEHVQ